MGGVFINYRVGDGAMIAGFLHRELVEAFGAAEVFYASQRIAPGDLFDREILSALGECEVLLAVIGPRWLTATKAYGARRLDDEEDWVRREIAVALTTGIRVIPILVEDAPMPTAGQLPSDIRDLAYCTYLRLGHRHGEADAATIITLLRENVPHLAGIRHPMGQTRNAGARARPPTESHVIMPVPQQLPADVPRFVNRLADLERLDALLDKDVERTRTASVCVIAGTAGVGKTSLAVHWAHRVRADFPDGQLYINLRGYDPGEPVTPAQALERFLVGCRG